MPLSKEKNAVVHSGKKEPNHVYSQNDEVIMSVDNFADLGIVRTASAMYSDQCHSIASKATQIADAIRRIFRTTVREFLWLVFPYYVTTGYQLLFSVCSPILISDITITTIERA